MDAVKTVMREYSRMASENEEKRRLRTEKVYSAFPELLEIDTEIYKLGAENVKNLLKNPDNSQAIKAFYKKKTDELRERREEIIIKNGIDKNFDKIKYACQNCRDTGFTPDGKKCACFKKKLILERYKQSNLYERFEKESFKKFQMKYYSKEKDRNHEKSPYENMSMIFKRCLNFCEKFNTEQRGLLFYGPTGLGKTFLSSCIAKRLMDNEKTVLYLRAAQLFKMYEDYRFGRSSDAGIINDIYKCDLLIIDDLGTEQVNKNNNSLLFDLINDRFTAGKKIIISTNLNMDELSNVYSARLTSRIYEYFYIYGFYGEDIRIQKLRE